MLSSWKRRRTGMRNNPVTRVFGRTDRASSLREDVPERHGEAAPVGTPAPGPGRAQTLHGPGADSIPTGAEGAEAGCRNRGRSCMECPGTCDSWDTGRPEEVRFGQKVLSLSRPHPPHPWGRHSRGRWQSPGKPWPNSWDRSMPRHLRRTLASSSSVHRTSLLKWNRTDHPSMRSICLSTGPGTHGPAHHRPWMP